MSDYGNSPVGMKENIAIPQQQNMEPLLGPESKRSRNEPSSPTGSQFSQAYGGAAQNFYQTECQKNLQAFLKRFKHEAATKKNERQDAFASEASFTRKVGASDSEDELSDNDNGKGSAVGTPKNVKASKFNAPANASKCATIQKLDEFIDQMSKEKRQPNEIFFDLSQQYYEERFTNRKEAQINVQSYIQSQHNLIRDMQVDIVATKRGCVPYVKTLEVNLNNQRKFIKAVKFYVKSSDNDKQYTLKNQIIVDEGIAHNNYRIYDTSKLNFGNTLLFYRREEYTHRLIQYDVVNHTANVLQGYDIQEPAGQDVKYHIIFSQGFGKGIKSSKKYADVHAFLSDQYVCCQSFRSNEQEFINMPMVIWRMNAMRNSDMLRPQSGQHQVLSEPIQAVCHTVDPKNSSGLVFMAIDPFCTNEFTLDPQQGSYSPYTQYWGHNELQQLQMAYLRDPTKSSQNKHDTLAPFYLHSNAQFIIQSYEVTLIIDGQDVTFDQYFYRTNENQFMLVYPNYSTEKDKQKSEVLKQIAQGLCYYGSPTLDYQYNQDFSQRSQDYLQEKFIKISHIDSDCLSKCDVKSNSHLSRVIRYPRHFTTHDRIIMATDQMTTSMYVYQPSVMQGDNIIDIIEVQNDFVQAEKVRKLPQIIEEIRDDQLKWYGNERQHTKKSAASQENFMINAKYKAVVSTTDVIKTTVGEQLDPSKHVTFQMDLINRDTNIIVEANGGMYKNLRLKQDHNESKIKLQYYQRTKKYYIFFLELINEQKAYDIKKTYFAVRKSIAEIEELSIDNYKAVVENQTDVVLFLENDLLGANDAEICDKFTEICTFEELVDLQNQSYETQLKGHLNLTFQICQDNKTQLEFVPFIYQERKTIDTHCFCIFNIESMCVVKTDCILPHMKLRKYLRFTEAGFANYQLTRTSDVYDQKFGFFSVHQHTGDPSHQISKFQIAAQFYLKQEGDDDEEFEFQDEKHIGKSTIEMNEYLVEFHCCGQNNLKLISRKQILFSELFQQNRNLSIKKLYILPFFDKVGKIKGSQLILQEDGQVINITDQDDNKIYQQETDLAQFGYKKYLTNTQEQEEYLVIVASQFKQETYMQSNLENSESFFILNKLQKKLVSMRLCKFENNILNDNFDLLLKDQFFQPQEVLDGKNICELCLDQPINIDYGLRQKKQVIENLEGSLIDDLCAGDELLLQYFIDISMAEKTNIVNVDYTFVTTLRKGMELNKNQSVKLLFDRIFEENSPDSQEFMMLDLPKFLEMPNTDRIYNFLYRDFVEYNEIKKEQDELLRNPEGACKHVFCNMEDFSNHPDLPPFASVPIDYHVKERFKDYHNFDKEVIAEVVAKDPYMTFGVATFKEEELGNYRLREERNFEVEHSYVDFRKLIIGEKIRKIQEEKEYKIIFNDRYLAGILCIPAESDEKLEFYDLETVRKIIDFQYVTTGKFVSMMLYTYVFGFMTPIMLSIYVTDKVWLNIFFSVAFLSQLFFIFFEFLQLKEAKLAYFKDFWNYIDVSQFVIFNLIFAYRMVNQFSKENTFISILNGVLLVISLYKLLYFARVFAGVSFIMQMCVNLAFNVIPFLGLVLVVLLVFTEAYSIGHMGINDTTGEYAQIDNKFLKMLLVVYKSTSGSKNTPTVDQAMTDRLSGNETGYAMTQGILMGIWIAQQAAFGFLGMLFVGQVLQGYEQNATKMRMYLYRTKAKFNEDSYAILDKFIQQRQFKVVCFQMAKDIKEKMDKAFQGVSHGIKFAQEQQDNLRREAQQKSVAANLAIQDEQGKSQKNLNLVTEQAQKTNQQLSAMIAELQNQIQNSRCMYQNYQ